MRSTAAQGGASSRTPKLDQPRNDEAAPARAPLLIRIRSVDRDRLPVVVPGPAVHVVYPIDPEVDDRPEAEELLAGGVPEVVAGLGRHHPAHEGPATLAH